MAGTKPHPFSLRIFLPDGTPEGLRILEKSNWTGCGVHMPRAVFAEARTRDEFSRTGVYILVGASDDPGLPTVYIGQADVIRARLDGHHRNKDFWTWDVIFASNDDRPGTPNTTKHSLIGPKALGNSNHPPQYTPKRDIALKPRLTPASSAFGRLRLQAWQHSARRT